MNAVERSTDALAGDLKRIVRHSEELLQNTTEAVGEKGCEARKRLTAAVRSAGDTCVELQKRSAEAAKAADRLVRKHPYETIAAAIALGLVSAILLSRKW